MKTFVCVYFCVAGRVKLSFVIICKYNPMKMLLPGKLSTTITITINKKPWKQLHTNNLSLCVCGDTCRFLRCMHSMCSLLLRMSDAVQV